MRYLILVIVEALLIFLSIGKDLTIISPWLLGINFTVAVFSVNFTFFGHQLSRYKSILGEVTRRQWFNIVLLLALPFAPLIIFLLKTDYYAHTALFLLPVIALSSVDNALLTKSYLDPLSHLRTQLTPRATEKYLQEIYRKIEREVELHKKYLENRDKFQIPAHEWSFKTDLLGLERHDLWDRISTVLKQSVENNDYPVFQSTLDHALDLLLASYRYPSQKKDDYREMGGLQSVSRDRFRGLSQWVLKNDDEGIYIESWANRLCSFLRTPEALENPLGELTEGIMSDVTYIGSIMLSNDKSQEPMKILNTIHAVIELAIHQIDAEEKAGKDRILERYSIAGYAHLIQSLGRDAILARKIHYVYRCMETLSFLGCNSAKIHSRQSVVACFEALVQLGRICRKEVVGCFWSRCIIPLHLHAEEFMGHILTWLVRDLKEDGSFPLKACAEQAYSRLRGYKCQIIPKVNLNPKFWIEEECDNDGKPISHIEMLSGMYGYEGKVDYSQHDDLTEYCLLDFD